MNVRRMEKLAKLLDRLPKGKLNMQTWFYPSRNLWEKTIVCETDIINDCGSTCCIAGWTVISAGKCFNGENGYVVNHSGRRYRTKKSRAVWAREFAQKYLDLNSLQVAGLVYDWEITTPQQAAKRIREMIQEAK